MYSTKKYKNREANMTLRRENPNVKRIVDGEPVSFHRPPEVVEKEKKEWLKKQAEKESRKVHAG